MSTKTSLPLAYSPGGLSARGELQPYPTLPMVPVPSSKDIPNSQRMHPLRMTSQDTESLITCYGYPGDEKPIKHGKEQRYVSPTTGLCRKLVIQAVNPKGPGEHPIECPIKDHASGTSKLALWLCSTSPFSNGTGSFFEWSGKFLLYCLKLLWAFIGMPIRLLCWGDVEDDSDLYNTGYYKPYLRPFWGQLWAARSSKEYSSRTKDKKEEEEIPTQSLYPRLLMIKDTGGGWKECKDTYTIIHTKFIAITYCAADIFPKEEKEKEESEKEKEKERAKEKFKQDVRVAVVQQGFNAYWLDLECVGEVPVEKKKDLYCMADVYRGAEITMVILGTESGNGDVAWKNWGARVWTFPEALLSRRLCYKFRDKTEIEAVSLHDIANLAYSEHELEQAIMNAYDGRDPLERLERLTLLKSAIWRRGIKLPESAQIPSTSAPSSSGTNEGYAADRVYALMGFFDHRIQPDYFESELRALARLSMANDSDRIAERMVSLLPTTISQTECWYADDDVYSANLWDIVPEIQVAGITKNGSLVLDGCKAASIRWKDFPGIALNKTDSVRRELVGIVPYLAWPIIIFGSGLWTTAAAAGILLFLCGIILLLLSPRLFVYRESGRVAVAQPWLIGVKGILDIEKAILHLYGGGTKGKFRRLGFTPSGSEFAEPKQDLFREGSEVQYDKAIEAERGPKAGRTYTLIDTCSQTIYYFCADRPPTVCLFTGREGGLGRFVLCSERCHGTSTELHKETVLRMPTELSQKMELCGWVALG